MDRDVGVAADVYCNSQNALKRMIVRRVARYDALPILQQLIAAGMRAQWYFGNVRVTVETRAPQIVIEDSADFSRNCRSSAMDAVCLLTCLCLICLPLKKLYEEDVEVLCTYDVSIAPEAYMTILMSAIASRMRQF